ncbi:MAG TPA: hypothetical protein VK578_15390 [Edaphobacter sp.]|nr:hypothetical protein [Edaphobacter sp.]
MRSSFRSLLLVLACVVAGSVSARADLITLSVSEQGTGTLGGQAFTNRLLTFSASFPTALLASPACQSDGLCFIDNFVILPPGLGLDVTLTVPGIGTFLGEDLESVAFLYSGNLQDIFLEGIDAVGGRFSAPTSPRLLGGSCFANFDPSHCPIFFETNGGDLILSSVGNSYSTSVVITDTSAVSEPSAFTLLALGLIGLTTIFQRRLKISLQSQRPRF